MKAKENYKMTYELKRVLSTIADPHHRGEIKRLMIDAEKSYARHKKSRASRQMPADTSDSE